MHPNMVMVLPDAFCMRKSEAKEQYGVEFHGLESTMCSRGNSIVEY